MTPRHAFALALVLPLVTACSGTIIGGAENGGQPSTQPARPSTGGSGTGGSNAGEGGEPGTGGGEPDAGGWGGEPDAGGGGSEPGTGGSTTTSCQLPECTLGQSQMSCCGYQYDYTCVEQTCVLIDGCAEWDNYCSTPLVISFDDAPVAYHTDPSHGFQLSASRPTPTDWPTARTPWLALDRNGNGSIDDGSELFGSMTLLEDGRRAVNGFEALRALDADGDGFITERDPAFAELVLWSDRDGDRRTGEGELAPLAQAGIVSIDLRYVSDPRCDGRGNCEVERAPLVYRDAAGALRTGAIVDVHLAAQR
jgi:hypothetical protein